MLKNLKSFLSKPSNHKTKQSTSVTSGDQKIEAPNEEDMRYIATLIVRANAWAKEITGKELNYSLDDLFILQQIIDSKEIVPDQTYELQSLGIAFGKIFVENNDNYDWWMVEGPYGRDVCLRYKDTTLLLFPQTMISKRIENQEEVDMIGLYDVIVKGQKKIIEENYPTQH